jgi:UDP-N-acetylglucosamine 2-epimerase (non-hydrolysing)
MKVLTIFGTRPEAIKMAPVVRALGRDPAFDARVCVTGQHRGLLDGVLDAFGIVPDHDLGLMQTGQTLNGLSARAIAALDSVLEAEAPDRVLVHGDTTTAMAGALAAFHRGIPVGHVEAGLRTGDLARPFPEEMNRRVIDQMADHLYAPTRMAREALLAEGLGTRRIAVTGNTGIDALTLARTRLATPGGAAATAELRRLHDPARKLLLVTSHRRENHGSGLSDICDALTRLARRDDLQIFFPVHPNPQVSGPVHARLGALPSVHLMEPLDYLPFVWALDAAHLVLTDSGGVQEEAPSLGTPVLVMRDVTERPEAVAAGTARLVGTDRDRIVAAVTHLLANPAEHRRVAGLPNPYGDGHATTRILDALRGRPVAEFDVPAPLARVPLVSAG